MESQIFQNLITWFLTSGLRVVVIVFGASLATRLISTLIRKLIKPIAKEGSRTKGVIDRTVLKQREMTLEGAFISFTKFTIWIIAILMILSEFRINITPLLGGAGIVGLAIGMGSRSLIQDYISGLFILLEDQYRVGEEIEIAGVRGEVKSLDLRRTILEDSEGTIHYIPNGQVKRVSNFSRKAKKS